MICLNTIILDQTAENIVGLIKIYYKLQLQIYITNFENFFVFTSLYYLYFYFASFKSILGFAEIGGKILAIFDMNRRICNSLSVSKEGYIVVDVTNFFAEQGGQLSDTGILFDKNRVKYFKKISWHV